MNVRKSIGVAIEFPPQRTLPWFGAHIGILLTKEMDGARDVLPEPWDLADHIGNMPATALLSTFAALLAGKARALKTNVPPESTPYKLGLRGSMVAAGVFAGILANAIAETKLGHALFPFFGSNNTNPVDFNYGIIAGAVAGFVPEIIQNPLSPERQLSRNQPKS